MDTAMQAVVQHMAFMFNQVRPSMVPGLGGDIQAWLAVIRFCEKQVAAYMALGDVGSAMFFRCCAAEGELKVVTMVIKENASIDAKEAEEVSQWKS